MLALLVCCMHTCLFALPPGFLLAAWQDGRKALQAALCQVACVCARQAMQAGDMHHVLYRSDQIKLGNCVLQASTQQLVDGGSQRQQRAWQPASSALGVKESRAPSTALPRLHRHQHTQELQSDSTVAVAISRTVSTRGVVWARAAPITKCIRWLLANGCRQRQA